MLEQHFNSLNSVDQVVASQAAANQSYKIILDLEKRQLEETILKLYQLENESDSDFARRFIKYKTKLDVINDFIQLNKHILKTLQGD